MEEEELISSTAHGCPFTPKSSSVSSVGATRATSQPISLPSQQQAWTRVATAGDHWLAQLLWSTELLSTHLNQVRNHHGEQKVKKKLIWEGLLFVYGHYTCTVNKHLSSQRPESKLPLSTRGIHTFTATELLSWVPTLRHARFIFTTNTLFRDKKILYFGYC